MPLVLALPFIGLVADDAAATMTTAAPVFLSRLDAALGPQDFQLRVAAGGAAVLQSSTGETLSTISTSFSEPGPAWNNFSLVPNPKRSHWWTVTVDSSRATEGVWTVVGVGRSYKVIRTLALDPRPPALPRRVLVNDTLSTTPGGISSHSASGTPPGAGDVTGVHVKHTATVAATEGDVDTAVVPGTYGNWYCGTQGNPGDDCSSPCLDPNVLMTNNGRPDVFANRSGFAIGLTALDDVFRVHAQTHQRAMKTGPRMGYMGMACDVSEPPSIELADPMLALRNGGDSHTLSWAIYPLTGGGSNATDYFSFVNAQRHDLRTDTITIPQTGFLGPMSSSHGDTTLYNNTGWSSCWNQSAPWSKSQRSINAKTCWEHWDAKTFLSYIQTQAGPGGTLQVVSKQQTCMLTSCCGFLFDSLNTLVISQDNEDMIGDDEDPQSCGSQVPSLPAFDQRSVSSNI